MTTLDATSGGDAPDTPDVSAAPLHDRPYRPHPIAAHRLVSDGRSSALLTPNGVIDWWCWPRMHSVPLAWSLLDRNGGHASFVGATHVRMDDAPAGPTARTTVRIDSQVVEIWDGLIACGDTTDLVRFVRATNEPLDIAHSLHLGGFDRDDLEWHDGHLRLPDGPILWIDGGVTTFGRDGTARTRLQAARGEWTLFTLRAHEHVHERADVIAALERAEQEHRDALDECTLPRTHSQRAKHALAVFDACTDRVTGAVIASPTTSLPEVVGGDRQFDYRFTWLRDAASAISVAALLGRDATMDRYAAFLDDLGIDRILKAPVHDVDGGDVPDEREIPCVDGWGRSLPVRTGNAAASQLQWDAIGMVLDAMYVQARRHRRLPRPGWQLVVALADRACEDTDEPSNGIWELRDPAMLVSADIGRWLALDRAIRIARMTHPLGVRRVWKRERRAARARVLDAIRVDGTLPHVYGGDSIDASALLLVVYRLLPPADPRAGRLVDATIAQLASGPLLYRYPPDGSDGFAPGEAPFVPASWWAVTALALLGRADAQSRADELCGMLPALLPEEFDPVRGEALGNTPLVWSHAECARALFELDRQHGVRARARRGLARAITPTRRGRARLQVDDEGQASATGTSASHSKEPTMGDVVDLIEQDHREVEQMFAEFKKSHDKSKAIEICDELDRHTKAEDEAVYPVFEKELSNEKAKIDDAEDEHKEARQLIGRIRQTDDEGHLVDLMNQLEQAIKHHVEEEESDMLPKARNELPAEELDELGDKFEEAKESAS
jgi:GH15 family glucan-1,4-alpha-glucosidase/hemerythrin-like domain-containing protein